MKKAFLLLCTFSFAVSMAKAKIINVPQDHSSISEALQVAAEGDTILLAAGSYPQEKELNINKAVILASLFVMTHDPSDIENTLISATKSEMAEWVELSARNAHVVGFTFLGTAEHTLNITSNSAVVTHCRFICGKDQLSVSGGGGYIGTCYFENAGEDGIYSKP